MCRLRDCSGVAFLLFSFNRLFLFSLREKLKLIAQATYTHSRNLAYFVFIYKGLMALQSQLLGEKIPFHSFLAACIGGWLVFGENNPINSQVNVFVESFLDKNPNRWMFVCQESGWYGLACFWWFLSCSVILLSYYSLHKFWFWLLCIQILAVVVCLCERCVQFESEKPSFTPRAALIYFGRWAGSHAIQSHWVTPLSPELG